jgi:hypothetical protein
VANVLWCSGLLQSDEAGILYFISRQAWRQAIPVWSLPLSNGAVVTVCVGSVVGRCMLDALFCLFLWSCAVCALQEVVAGASGFICEIRRCLSGKTGVVGPVCLYVVISYRVKSRRGLSYLLLDIG